jgi:uncharacterized protein DUF1877
MSMIGELRRVPAAQIGALNDAAIEKLQDGEGLSLDKAWDGLRYLLLGRCKPNPMEDGEVLDGGDCGYGPAQLLEPDEVRACARSLAAIDEAKLRAAFDPDAMVGAEVYPSIWDREAERAQNLEWLIGAFRDLRAFCQDAGEHGDAVMFYLT